MGAYAAFHHVTMSCSLTKAIIAAESSGSSPTRRWLSSMDGQVFPKAAMSIASAGKRTCRRVGLYQDARLRPTTSLSAAVSPQPTMGSHFNRQQADALVIIISKVRVSSPHHGAQQTGEAGRIHSRTRPAADRSPQLSEHSQRHVIFSSYPATRAGAIAVEAGKQADRHSQHLVTAVSDVSARHAAVCTGHDTNRTGVLRPMRRDHGAGKSR